MTRVPLALALMRLERPAEAIEILRALVSLEPDNADVHALLGAALLLKAEPPQAVRALERARRLDPGHADAREMLVTAKRVGGP